MNKDDIEHIAFSVWGAADNLLHEVAADSDKVHPMPDADGKALMISRLPGEERLVGVRPPYSFGTGTEA